MTGRLLDAAAVPVAASEPADEGRPPGLRRLHPALRVALVVVLLLITALQLRAVLRSGYSNDDVANSQIPMETRADGRSLLEYWGDQTEFWREVHGRFIPVSGLETILVFSTLTTRLAYKVFQVLVAVAAMGVFVLFVRRLTGQLWAALLAGLAAAAAIQVRAWNDPWLQYNGQQATALMLVLAAFLAFLAFARGGSRAWVAVALVPWTAVLMLYETTWAFLVLFPLLALGGAASRRARAVGCAVMALPVLVLGLLLVGWRADASEPTTSYTTRLDPAEVLPTFVEQTTAALPLSYSTFGPAPADRPWTVAALLPDPLDLVVAAGAVVLVVVALPRLRPMHRDVRWQLAGIGAAFWGLPAGVVATTVRWQEELRPGLGYVSVYVQTFGMALVGLAALAWWRGRRRRDPSTPLVVGLAVVAALALVVTQHTTQRAVEALQSLRWDREVLSDAIRHGLFAAVDDGEGVLSLRHHGWINPAFVQWYGGPEGPVQFDPPAGCRPLRTDCLLDGGFTWVMTPEYGAGEDHGHVLLVPLAGVGPPAEGGGTVFGAELRAYVRHPDAGPDRRPPEVRVRVAEAVDGVPAIRAATPDEVEVDAAGDGWWLLRVTPRQGVVDAQFLQLGPGPAR